MRDDSLLLILVPELAQVTQERYNILHQISLLSPVGRHLLAVSTKLSESAVRTHLTIMAEQGLVEVRPNGISLSRKGETLLTSFSDALYKDPILEDMEKRLQSLLSMERVVIVRGDSDASGAVKANLGCRMAHELTKVVRDESILAVGGGETLSLMTDALPEIHSPISMRLTVVPARGGFGAEIKYQANLIAARTAEKLGGTYKLLHVPDGISPGLIRQIRNESPETAEVESLIHRADILAITINGARDMAKVHQLPLDVCERLHEEGVCGEALGVYADIHGKVLYRMYNLGISADELSSVSNVLIAAGGSHKARAILSMARAGVRGVLITDEGAAKAILELTENNN
uniref:sugar-binding transcriptional regulator n=1 Tax=uncultured Allisonella sp. TaxID=339338 RepID=UPI002804E692|nr:sugar-binding domain-containing protein [uncultured Allisonella sp.]